MTEQMEVKEIMDIVGHTIMKNNDLKDFYKTVFSDLNQGFIASAALNSNDIQVGLSNIGETVGSIAGTVLSLIPLVGFVCAKIFGAGGAYNDMKYEEHKVAFSRISKLTKNTTDFEKISQRVAVYLTQQLQEFLKQLKRAQAPSSWFDSRKNKIVSNNILSLVQERKCSCAMLFGRLFAAVIIKYLMEPDVTDELSDIKSDDNYRSYVLISKAITNKVNRINVFNGLPLGEYLQYISQPGILRNQETSGTSPLFYDRNSYSYRNSHVLGSNRYP